MMKIDANQTRFDVRVGLGARSYDIVIEAGIMSRAGVLMKPLLHRPFVVVITDRNVAGPHLPPLLAGLKAAGIDHHTITLPAGEATKSYARVQSLCEQILALGIDRSTTLIALGGGVIGDLAGFVAAILLRGIDFIQIPTTLLSQVDSAVGGKTGINSAHGKNLIGAFHQPRLVLADVASLETLPDREMRAGFAEVIKYGAINNRAFFDWLAENATALLNGDRGLLCRAVAFCCDAKAAIVSADETEHGQRALLNLGHTFAHALEREAGYGDALLHGEAVAIGLAMAFELSTKMGLTDGPEQRDALIALLRTSGLPVNLPDQGFSDWDADRLIAHMSKDKKVQAGRATFILARSVGAAFITRDVPPDLLRETVQAAVSGTLR